MMNVRRLLPLLLAMFVLAGCASSQPSSSGPSEPAPSETTDDRSAPQDTTTADAPGAEDDRDAERSVPLVPKRAPSDWQHQSPDAGVIPGIATDKAYATVLDGREPQQTVVVAIIDSGVDVEHEDLEGVIWTNEDEVPGNGKDDDGNGYVDDVHGWNFVGGPDGENVDHAPMELTRMVREYEKEFAGVDSASVSPENRDAYERYQELEAKLNRMRSNKQQEFNNVRNAYEAMNFATELLQQQLGGDSLTVAAVRQLGSPRQDVQQARDIYLYFSDNDLTLSDIEEYKSNLENQLKYGYDLDFNPRPTSPSASTATTTSRAPTPRTARTSPVSWQPSATTTSASAASPAGCASCRCAPCPTATSATKTWPTPSATPPTTAPTSST